MIERTSPMRVHKNLIISWLESRPEDEKHIVPDEWRGKLSEYLNALRNHPAQSFVGGELKEEPR